MDVMKSAKSSQEQALASWINYLNQVRLSRLLETLRQEKVNWEAAESHINDALITISEKIINNGQGRGGEKGVHGFIAEVAECGIANAREAIEGKAPNCIWIDDNGPYDLERAGVLIQQKFVNAQNRLSLRAIKEHLEHYPDFLDKGGKYNIPSDHYEKIKYLLSIDQDTANKLPTETGEFSLSQWEYVHKFFTEENVTLDSIEPSYLEYSEVQKNTYEDSLVQEKENLRTINEEKKEVAYKKSQPTLKEGIKVAAVGAVAEGATAFALGVLQKKKEGKSIRDFNSNDWEEITGNSGRSLVKGGVRGISIYGLTNFTATPAAVASGLVAAAFGVAEQAHRYRNGEIDELSLIENSESLCMDAAVSVISAFAGQTLIPIPILGAVIGNAVGTTMFQIAKDNLSEREAKVFKAYYEDVCTLEEDLQMQYQNYMNEVSKSIVSFMKILDKAFAPDVRGAFYGSIELAKEVGVPINEILDSRAKITDYFVN